MPAAIQPEITWYSTEPTGKRRPPPCAIVSVGFSRMRLLAGSSLSVRRASDWRVSV